MSQQALLEYGLRTERSSIESNIGNTPLLSLPKINQDLPEYVEVLAKGEHLNPGGLKVLAESRWCAGQHRKRSPMHRHDLAHAEPFGGNRGVFRAHRVVIADR